MYSLVKKSRLQTLEDQLYNSSNIIQALNLSSAVIEFEPNGTILTANDNFLGAVGYRLEEIVNQHHRIFLHQEDVNSSEYQNFWSTLASGKAFTGRFKRKNKAGQTLWLEAAYNPVKNESGKVIKVIKIAADITAAVNNELEQKALFDALDDVMAIIEFDPKGNILKANDAFCQTMQYKLDEIKGKHHSLFVDPDEVKSAAYQQFWKDLEKGQKNEGIYKRFRKNGEMCSLKATYSPISDASGKVYKVVKFASDITKENIREELEDAISRFSVVLSALSEGDLTKKLPSGHFKGALHNLKNAISYSILKMNEVVGSVTSVAEHINHSAAEVAEGAMSLNQRVQQQASALEETSATMNEMTSQVQSSAQNARQASEVARSVKEKAHNGMEVMQQTINAMTAIEESSTKISEIVSIIDGIAFQTNLLALNAAVEAARAGEHGRGFAVVAAEVRNLAQKSAESAKDIKKLIDETTERVSQGTSLAGESGKMLGDINESIESVTQMINEIAIATQEQSEGVHQVHQAITQIDGVTQQNAALVEETSAAAESLNEQAAKLQSEMDFFKPDPEVKQLYLQAPVKSMPTKKPKQAQAALTREPQAKASLPNKASATQEWAEF